MTSEAPQFYHFAKIEARLAVDISIQDAQSALKRACAMCVWPAPAYWLGIINFGFLPLVYWLLDLASYCLA